MRFALVITLAIACGSKAPVAEPVPSGSAGTPTSDAAVATIDASMIGGGPPDCAKDSDCVFVPASCCPCSSGGHNFVMSRADAAKHERPKCDAKATNCLAVFTTTLDCVGHPACANGRCVAAEGRAP